MKTKLDISALSDAALQIIIDNVFDDDLRQQLKLKNDEEIDGLKIEFKKHLKDGTLLQLKDKSKLSTEEQKLIKIEEKFKDSDVIDKILNEVKERWLYPETSSGQDDLSKEDITILAGWVVTKPKPNPLQPIKDALNNIGQITDNSP